MHLTFFVIYGDNFLRHCRQTQLTWCAVCNTPAHCSQISYPIQESEVVAPMIVPTERQLHDESHMSESDLIRGKALCLFIYTAHIKNRLHDV